MDQATQLRNIIKANSVNYGPKARVLTVTSGKGGVGKSNVSINLAVKFSKMGKKVVILDADFGLANIEVMFGAIPKYNLADLIYKGMGIKDIITEGPDGVGFISGGSGIAGLTNLGKDYINYLIQNLAQLDTLYDVIIIDTGAGISDAVLEFLVASREILLVTTPEPTSITDSYSLLKALNRDSRFNREMTEVKIIANKTENFEEGKQLYTKLSTVVSRYLKLPMKFVGVIPNDSQLVKAVMQQSPVSISAPNSRASLAFDDLAKTLMSEDGQMVTTKHGMAGFFASMVKGKRFT
ncbi:MAG: MinD/ParA family protein [Lachnospiraceae bacterium]|nr:MinD/ParA family protein [Lachnospiraceae bacterium]